MQVQTRPMLLIIALAASTFALPAAAWTPYGYNPYGYPHGAGSGPPEQVPENSPGTGPSPPSTMLSPPSGDPGAMAPPHDSPEPPFDMFPPGFSAPPFDFPGYGPPPGFAEGFPGGRSAGFRPPGRFRISQDASEQAYGLTIELQGTDPAAIQVRPDGRFLVISRERTEQQVQKDSFDDGRGFMRSFSYSTGNTKRRIRVPRDADLSAISREDSKERIRITIPRRPAAESWQPEGR